MDKRKNVKVMPHVKDELKVIKDMLQVSTESHAVEYLLRVYRNKRLKITLAEHEEALKETRESHNQLTL
ncbi:hypothetical protein J6TS7_21000 [Paenibacillus dendritiformis]|uniref:hypothetical protein n=1 Tax=Paenibacillus dendritiformis TaxID=130049 RepID=UPI001B0671BE|nr:hypothetical protein [Paenibacillus dendritiformis]GIO78490.1 hypothetical protein J6TS7_21000 [Paenibacillus dendritiformis]